MAEQAELAFVKAFVNNLSSQPVTYADDFQQPPEKSLRKIPVLPVCRDSDHQIACKLIAASLRWNCLPLLNAR